MLLKAIPETEQQAFVIYGNPFSALGEISTGWGWGEADLAPAVDLHPKSLDGAGFGQGGDHNFDNWVKFQNQWMCWCYQTGSSHFDQCPALQDR